MSEPAPETPEAHAWLPSTDTATWLQLDDGSPLTGVADWCRQASAAYCERQRPDLFLPTAPPPTGDVVMAGLIGAARLFARRSSPAGLASFGEFGASEVLRLDPDVSRLLGVGRHGTPAVG